LAGQKPPLKPKEIWSIRIRLHVSGNARDLALFNLAYDRSAAYLFPGRRAGTHLSVRQYATLAKGWFASIGLDPARYGTHSLRRTKGRLIYVRPRHAG
jgi:hypothetical protein